ncbi:helix-turn-helix domain-containing protein [Thomasclavelia sp.]
MTAYDCGFDNPSYFSIQFKKITNMTPRAYRNLHYIT